MAKSEHLELLNQGVKEWNQWRVNNPYVIPDLSGVHLIGTNLSGVDLRKVNLSDAKLDGVILRAANLSRANLSRALLLDVDLTGANLSEAIIHGFNMVGGAMDGVDMSGIAFCSGAMIGGVGNSSKTQTQRLVNEERQTRATLVQLMATMAKQVPKYDLRYSQFAGGFAETVQGNQVGGIVINHSDENNHSANGFEDITNLLSTLRTHAQSFPGIQKEETLDILEDLERDLTEEPLDLNRIGRRLKKLITISTQLAELATGLASNVVTIYGALTDFTTNVIELTKKLGIPIE